MATIASNIPPTHRSGTSQKISTPEPTVEESTKAMIIAKAFTAKLQKIKITNREEVDSAIKGLGNKDSMLSPLMLSEILDGYPDHSFLGIQMRARVIARLLCYYQAILPVLLDYIQSDKSTSLQIAEEISRLHYPDNRQKKIRSEILSDDPDLERLLSTL